MCFCYLFPLKFSSHFPITIMNLVCNLEWNTNSRSTFAIPQCLWTLWRLQYNSVFYYLNSMWNSSYFSITIFSLECGLMRCKDLLQFDMMIQTLKLTNLTCLWMLDITIQHFNELWSLQFDIFTKFWILQLACLWILVLQLLKSMWRVCCKSYCKLGYLL